MLSIVLLGACGKKTGLIVYDDSTPEPTIAALSSEVSGQMLQLQLDIAGGSGAVVYQIDRAKIDPNCQCINNWLRYYESSPSTQRTGLQRNIKIRQPEIAYAFRVRVMDSIGRKSAWSKVIKVNVSRSKVSDG